MTSWHVDMSKCHMHQIHGISNQLDDAFHRYDAASAFACLHLLRVIAAVAI